MDEKDIRQLKKVYDIITLGTDHLEDLIHEEGFDRYDVLHEAVGFLEEALGCIHIASDNVFD